jgi:hypothetical protein
MSIKEYTIYWTAWYYTLVLNPIFSKAIHVLQTLLTYNHIHFTISLNAFFGKICFGHIIVNYNVKEIMINIMKLNCSLYETIFQTNVSVMCIWLKKIWYRRHSWYKSALFVYKWYTSVKRAYYIYLHMLQSIFSFMSQEDNKVKYICLHYTSDF